MYFEHDNIINSFKLNNLLKMTGNHYCVIHKKALSLQIKYVTINLINNEEYEKVAISHYVGHIPSNGGG